MPPSLRALAALLPLVASSCVTPIRYPDLSAVESADVGPEPAAATYELAIDGWLDKNLRDPGSKIVEVTRTPRRRAYQPLLIRNEWKAAWRVETTVNAKNGYGGYTGASPFEFYFLGEQLVAVIDVDDHDVYEYHGGGVTVPPRE